MTTATKQRVEVTKAQLEAVLAPINYVTMASMVSICKVEMNKYDAYWLVDAATGKKSKNPNAIANPYFEKGIQALSKKYKIITGFDYVKSVFRRRENEGKDAEFDQGDIWFNQISKALVEHKEKPEKKYFRYQYLDDSILSMEYFYDGQPIDYNAFSMYKMPPSTYSNQDLNNALKIQVVSTDNIRELTLNGTHYVVVE